MGSIDLAQDVEDVHLDLIVLAVDLLQCLYEGLSVVQVEPALNHWVVVQGVGRGLQEGVRDFQCHLPYLCLNQQVVVVHGNGNSPPDLV